MDDKNFDKKSAIDWIQTIENNDPRDFDIYPILKDWLKKSEAKSVLDIGCGQGICSQKIDLENCDYVGLDPSKFLVQKAQELYRGEKIEFQVGDIYELPFFKESFDSAFSIAVWHLLEDKLKASEQLARILINKGHFLIACANPEYYSEWAENYDHYELKEKKLIGYYKNKTGEELVDILYTHSLDEIKQSLQRNGLRIDKIEKIRMALVITGNKTS